MPLLPKSREVTRDTVVYLVGQRAQTVDGLLVLGLLRCPDMRERQRVYKEFFQIVPVVITVVGVLVKP